MLYISIVNKDLVIRELNHKPPSTMTMRNHNIFILNISQTSDVKLLVLIELNLKSI